MLDIENNSDFIIQPLPRVWADIIREKSPPEVSQIILMHDNGVMLAGGFLRWMVSVDGTLSPESTDIDLFFTSSEIYQETKRYFDDRTEKIFQCPEDLLATYRHSSGWNIQCIAIKFYPDAYHVIRDFDFTMCCFSTDGKDLAYHRLAIEDALNKALRWNKITYPASSLRRLMKFARRGFFMPEQEYQYFVDMIANHSPDIINSQIVYVD